MELVCIEIAHSGLWNAREASLFEFDPSRLSTCSSRSQPWTCSLFFHPLLLKRIFYFLLLILLFFDGFTEKTDLASTANNKFKSTMWHDFPYRAEIASKVTIKGLWQSSSLPNIRFIYLFIHSSNISCVLALCQTPCYALGTQRWTDSCLQGIHRTVEWQTSKQGSILHCRMSYANHLWRAQWDSGGVVWSRVGSGGWKDCEEKALLSDSTKLKSKPWPCPLLAVRC